jgi:hypothetical protein
MNEDILQIMPIFEIKCVNFVIPAKAGIKKAKPLPVMTADAGMIISINYQK